MKFQVPGNLILMGEYAVLEEGGLAVTAAVFPCAEGELRDEESLSGHQGNRNWFFSFPKEEKKECMGDLPASCWSILSEYAQKTGRDLRKQGVHINTDLFTRGEEKLGYGSSAAGAVAFVRGILGGQSWERPVSEEDIQELAYQAHRFFQGKKGSGYDVYTSCSQGINLFKNGNPRSIETLAIPFLPDLYLCPSYSSVSTVHSVDRYKEWKKDHPDESAEFIHHSNSLVRELTVSRNWKDGQRVLKSSAELALSLGKDLGISAEVQVPGELYGLSDTLWKASGAGNELAIIFSPHDLSSIPGVVKGCLYYG